MSGTLVGTRHLLRLALRRDRVRLPVWVLGITAMTAASSAAVQGLYDTPEKVASYGATVGNSAAGKLMNGTPVAVDNVGGITAYEVGATAAVLVALMVTFLVVRHTRAEEESGRAELLRGGVLGHHATTAAALALATVASVLVGALDAAVLLGSGLPASGSLLHGAALVVVGLVFTAVALVAAQVTSSARTALGIAGAVLAVLFVVRGVGAIRGDWLVWLSPLGWQEGVRAYGDERVWPLLPGLVTTAAVLALAAWLNSRRDEGAGLLAPRPGRPRASGLLGTPMGLAFRLQRGLLLGWVVGLGLLAALFGAVGREVITMVEDNPDLGAVFGTGGTGQVLDSFFAFSLSFLCVLAAAFGVSSALRLRHEEEAGRAEALLATPLTRAGWVCGALAITVGGSLLLLGVAGLAMGTTHALVSGDGTRVWPLLAAALAQAPALLLVVAAAVLVQGWWPRLWMVGWAVFAFAMLQAYLGELLRFPDWVAGISPYWHLPALPVDDFTATPALVVGLLAAVVGAAGVVGFQRRDLG